MTAKDFIKKELIDGIGAIVKDHPYIACIVMSCGIEFLGKCMDTNSPWDNNNPNKYFSDAIDALFPDSYKTTFQRKDLYSSLRCCLIHRFSPKENIALSNGGQHLQEISINGVNRIVINCAQLYEDFKKACNTVIKDSKYNQKTNSEFYTINSEQGDSMTASTENYLQAPSQ